MSSIDTRALVADYLKYRASQEGFLWPGQDISLPADPVIQKAQQFLRQIGRETEERHATFFNESCLLLHLTLDSAHETYDAVATELFRTGVNWGRLVSLLVFSGFLAVQCIKKEMPTLVEQVVEWTSGYIDGHLTSWFAENGRWDGFVAFFGQKNDSSWSSIKKLCGFALGTVVEVLTIGVLATRTA